MKYVKDKKNIRKMKKRLGRFSFNCVKMKVGTIIFLTYGEEEYLER